MPPRVLCSKPQLPRFCRPLRQFSSHHQPSQYNIAPLPHRRLISLTGHDASQFLQGLISQNVTTPTSSNDVPRALYSAFLNAAGRVLYDTILYPTSQNIGISTEESGWLIEVDEHSAHDLTKHLKRYKLRAEVQIRLIELGEVGISHAWIPSIHGEGPQNPLRGYMPSKSGGSNEGMRWFRDPRANPETQDYGSSSPNSGSSLPINEQQKPQQRSTIPLPHPSDFLHAANQVSTYDYHIHRLLNGLAEGPLEILPSQSLPLESNMDLLNGIDFRKGCYVGQELTIRTKHTGVVRKRILPVQLLDPSSPAATKASDQNVPVYDTLGADTASSIAHGADIKAEGNSKRSVGKWLGGVGNVGLSLCRLEPMVLGQGAQENVFWVGEGEGRRMVKAFVPEWMQLDVESGK